MQNSMIVCCYNLYLPTAMQLEETLLKKKNLTFQIRLLYFNYELKEEKKNNKQTVV